MEKKACIESCDLSTIAAQDITVLLQDGGKMITEYSLKTWAPLFDQSRDYENFVVEKIDSIVIDLLRQEENLQNQKNALVEKLTLVSRSLGVASAESQ